MNLEFRRAHTGDAAAIMDIIAGAQAFLRSQGLDQWQNGYPSAGRISRDIEDGIGYLLCANGAPAMYAVLDFRDEPSYQAVHGGEWLGPEPYATMHRVAADGQHRGGGLPAIMLQHIEDLARKGGAACLRSDTHPQNRPMRRFLEKGGFVLRGSIFIGEDGVGGEPGDERVAYEKIF